MESTNDLEKESPTESNIVPDIEESPFFSLIIQDLNGFYIRYDIINSNLVYGIRNFLLDIPTVCYVTNFDLVVESSGKKLEDFESVYEVGLKEYDLIKMIPCLYTTTSADFHLSRLNYILFEHPPFTNKSINNNEQVSRDLGKLIESSKAYFSQMTEIRQKMMGNFDKKENTSTKKEQNKNETKDSKESAKDSKIDSSTKQGESNTESTTKEQVKDSKQSNQAESSDKQNKNIVLEEALKSINDLKQKISEMDFKKFSLTNYMDSFIYEDNPKPQKIKCITSIYKSIYNNFINQNDKKGDLFYLELVTLEGKVVNITCSEKGFFINNTTPGIFDPKPAQHSYHSYTLVGLLIQISHLFKENFTKLISQVLNVDNLLFLASDSNKYEWLKSCDNSFYYNYRYPAFNTEMGSLKYMRLNKEWNEEYQAIIDLNFLADPIQNVTKEKLLYDFYKMFKETAIEGVKLIREKKISSFNFFDNPRANSGYYMYGNIFFTVLEDNYLDFRTFTVDDQKQTFLGSNLDLRHINYLNSVKHVHDIKDFYFSLNCIVHYKGLRVHAQVITPGVIFNSEHLVEYGEGEEGILKFNENFHEEYFKLCQKLNIREISAKDKNGKEYKICGNPEIKGVRGIDKRKYLFDLIHLFPRDLNYEGVDCSGCLIRPELLKEYQYKLIQNKIVSEHSEELKLINAELTTDMLKDPTSYWQFVEDKYKKRDELFEKVSQEIKPLLTMDTTIGTEPKYLKFQNEHLDKDEEFLKKLCKFLKEETITKFIQDMLKDEENSPNDSFSLTQFLHRYGIPIRYYGFIISHIESVLKFKKHNSWIYTLIVRDIIRRSAKHIFNELVRDIPDYLLKEFVAYFLNILLAPTNAIKMIDNFMMTYSNGELKNIRDSFSDNNLNSVNIPTNINQVQKETENKESKKKKKNKNKKKKQKEKDGKDETDLELKLLINESFANSMTNKTVASLQLLEDEKIRLYFIKPSQFWTKLKQIALKRYGYNDFEFVDPVMNKFGLLRDFCLTVGIQIEAIDYELYYETSNLRIETFKYSQMPFKAQNIIDFYPIVKDYQLPSEIHKPIYEQAETLFRAGNIIEAADKYKQLIYLTNEVYGQINIYSGNAHKKLGEIAYLEGDYMNAIVMLQKSIVILEKLYEFDTNNVANAYSELSTFYHVINQDYLAFKYISRSLEILNFTYSKNHPELINRICNLALYYVDIELIDNARDLVESSIKLCINFFEEDDKNLQKIWLILSHLSLKTYNLNRAISAYEKYLNIIKKSIREETTIKHGDKILEGLRIVADEIKKKQSFLKNKEDTKRVFDELCRKYVNNMYWEDLEKPLHKIYFDPGAESYLTHIFKKGMAKVNQN